MANRLSFFPRWLALGCLFLLAEPEEVFAGRTYSSGQLNDAYVLLAQATPIYKGHRLKAIQHVRLAANLSGARISGKAKVLDVPEEPNAKLRTAQSILHRVRINASGKSLEHVNKAIEEISIALSLR